MEFSPKRRGTGTTGLYATLAESLVPERVPWPAGCEGIGRRVGPGRGLKGRAGCEADREGGRGGEADREGGGGCEAAREGGRGCEGVGEARWAQRGLSGQDG